MTAELPQPTGWEAGATHNTLYVTNLTRSMRHLMRTVSRSIACFILLVFSSVLPLMGQDVAAVRHDLVIRQARIVDGTGNPWFLGDVGVTGDRITAVGRIPAGTGAKEIDGKGLVLAPGFIDIHSHSDTLLLEDGRAQSKIRQGVTTEVLGESDSAGPSLGKLPPRKLNIRGKELRWTTLGQYFETLEQEGTSVNVASYVGMGSVWRCVMGDSFERPVESERQQMRELVRQAMSDGAMGLSTMLASPPGLLATRDDVVDLCQEVARFGGIYSSHIRNEGTGVFDAVKEAIAIGEQAGVPVDIIHLKIADQQYWGRMIQIVGIIEAARARGVNVQANVYPYTRGNNDLASIIPPWAHEGGTDKLLERLKDPAQRPRIKKEIKEGLPGWYNHYTAVGGNWSRMLISKETTYKGLTMDRLLTGRIVNKKPPPDVLDVFLDYLIEEGGHVSTVYAHHTDDDMLTALEQPWCSIGSDGSALAIDGPLRRGNPHPRSFGTFPRVLGTYVRSAKILKLEDAIRKMTSLNAAKIGIRDRGLIRVGHYADLVLFDAERISDKATYTEPFQYSEGIHYVIVNGTVVLDHEEHTGKTPGKALRRG